MKGWGYIITNKSMPNLLNIGFSNNDPALKAEVLNKSGIPHPYLIEYDALVNEPSEVAQKAQAILSDYHVQKNWFKCDIATAVLTIKQVASDSIFLESNKVLNKENEKTENVSTESEPEKQSLVDDEKQKLADLRPKIKSHSSGIKVVVVVVILVALILANIANNILKQRKMETYNKAGNEYYSRREFDKAIEMYQKALPLEESVGSKKSQAILYRNLGNALAGVNFISEAERYYQKSIEVYKSLGDSDAQKVQSWLDALFVVEKATREKNLKLQAEEEQRKAEEEQRKKEEEKRNNELYKIWKIAGFKSERGFVDITLVNAELIREGTVPNSAFSDPSSAHKGMLPAFLVCYNYTQHLFGLEKSEEDMCIYYIDTLIDDTYAAQRTGKKDIGELESKMLRDNFQETWHSSSSLPFPTSTPPATQATPSSFAAIPESTPQQEVSETATTNTVSTENSSTQEADLTQLSCEALWKNRNKVFHDRGYCFKGGEALAIFDNTNCQYDKLSKVQLSDSDREYIKSIRTIEESKGCLKKSKQ